jgi:hypothetical protein
MPIVSKVALTVVCVNAALHLGSSPGECQGCDLVLAQGIVSTEVISRSVESRLAFEQWLCTTEFSTHSEARGAGVGPGAPVYGVPLQAAGAFSREQRSAWKEAHCEPQIPTVEHISRYRALLRYVQPAAFQAWSRCKRKYNVLFASAIAFADNRLLTRACG